MTPDHPAPKKLMAVGIAHAVRHRPANTEVVLPDGLLSTLYLDALIQHLTRLRSAQGNPS
jgi:hypothetical protein